MRNHSQQQCDSAIARAYEKHNSTKKSFWEDICSVLYSTRTSNHRWLLEPQHLLYYSESDVHTLHFQGLVIHVFNTCSDRLQNTTTLRSYGHLSCFIHAVRCVNCTPLLDCPTLVQHKHLSVFPLSRLDEWCLMHENFNGNDMSNCAALPTGGIKSMNKSQSVWNNPTVPWRGVTSSINTYKTCYGCLGPKWRLAWPTLLLLLYDPEYAALKLQDTNFTTLAAYCAILWQTYEIFCFSCCSQEQPELFTLMVWVILRLLITFSLTHRLKVKPQNNTGGSISKFGFYNSE